MTVSSLSHVTNSLETLLKENIEERLANTVAVNTSAVSPLNVVATSHLVNVFLFHVHPDGKPSIHENPGIHPPLPASYSKPVTLYYHLTVHHNAANGAHLVEQDLLGHALATLIDYPQLDDDLTIGGVTVLNSDLTLDGNVFELEIINKTESEALNVWAGYEGGAIRPSLYFKVKNVRLRPDAPRSFSGPILSIGKLVLPTLGPQLVSAQNTITASVPTDAGPVDRQFKRSPAELFIGAGAADRQIVLKGISLDPSAGVDLTLPVGNRSETLRVDFEANDARGWGIRAESDRIVIDWGSAIERPVEGVPVVHQLQPGTAQIRLARTEYLERDGRRLPVEMLSNPLALTLHPFITGIAPMGPPRFRINLAGGYDLTTLAPGAEHDRFVRLAIGGAAYEVVDAIAGLAPGLSAISGPHSLDFILENSPQTDGPAYVQLWIREAVSQPFWIGGN